MSVLDIILLLFLFGFIYGGFFNGLIRSLGSILGIVIGVWAANSFYLVLFNKIETWFGAFDSLGKIVCFIIVFILAVAATGFLVRILDKAYDFLSFIPFLKGINRLAGAFLGLLQGALIIGLILFLMASYLPADTFLGKAILDSAAAPIFIRVMRLIFPFLRSAADNINSLF